MNCLFLIYFFFAFQICSIETQLVLTNIINDPAGPENADSFGLSIAISGSLMVIGAPTTSIIGNPQQGVAYVYNQNGSGVWVQQATILEPNTTGVANDNFGEAVTVSGSTIVVGGPQGTSTSAGVVCIYVQSGNTWPLQQELVGNTADGLGNAVVLVENTLVVGMSAYSDGYNQGQAFVYSRSGTTWTLQYTFTDPYGQNGDWFGSNIAYAGGQIFISAYGYPAGNNQGTVYVFSGSGTSWSLQQQLNASDAQSGDEFGSALALSGNVLVVGAPDAGAEDYGAIYIFTSSGGHWTQLQKISDPVGYVNDNFGTAVSISTNQSIIMVGAPGINTQGAVYFYFYNGSSYVFELEVDDPNATTGDAFGTSVLISGNSFFVGAPGYQHTGGIFEFTGSIFVSTTAQQSITAQQGTTASPISSQGMIPVPFLMAALLVFVFFFI